jgi:hypothetical protein
MAEQLLNCPEVGPALEQVRSVRVPQRVRVEPATVREREPRDDPPRVACRERSTAAIQEHGVGWARVAREHGATAREPMLQRVDGRLAERHTPDF